MKSNWIVDRIKYEIEKELDRRERERKKQKQKEMMNRWKKEVIKIVGSFIFFAMVKKLFGRKKREMNA